MANMKTLQEMANEKALSFGLDPLAARTDEYYEYAPKSPDGVIWWVYKDTDESRFQLENGWTLVRRKIKTEKSKWEDVPNED